MKEQFSMFSTSSDVENFISNVENMWQTALFTWKTYGKLVGNKSVFSTDKNRAKRTKNIFSDGFLKRKRLKPRKIDIFCTFEAENTGFWTLYFVLTLSAEHHIML